MDALAATAPVIIGLVAVGLTIALARLLRGRRSADGWTGRLSASAVPLPSWAIVAALVVSGVLFIALDPASHGDPVPVAAVLVLCLAFGLIAFMSAAAIFGVERAWWSLLVPVAIIAVALATPVAPLVVGTALGLTPLLLGAAFFMFRRNASRR